MASNLPQEVGAAISRVDKFLNQQLSRSQRLELSHRTRERELEGMHELYRSIGSVSSLHGDALHKLLVAPRRLEASLCANALTMRAAGLVDEGERPGAHRKKHVRELPVTPQNYPPRRRHSPKKANPLRIVKRIRAYFSGTPAKLRPFM
jgi:hypothetical protein